jgi:hypothetical protein
MFRFAEQVDVSFKRLLKMNKPETQWAVVGCLASAVLGAQMPAFAVALSSVIAVFYEPVRFSVRPSYDVSLLRIYGAPASASACLIPDMTRASEHVKLLQTAAKSDGVRCRDVVRHLRGHRRRHLPQQLCAVGVLWAHGRQAGAPRAGAHLRRPPAPGEAVCYGP